MIGKVQQDSFHGLGIRLDSDVEPLRPGQLTPTHTSGESLCSLLRDCQVGQPRPIVRQTSVSSSPKSPGSPSSPPPQQQQPSSRYKTELCRPYQEHGSCKYGEKCQFAHGQHELRNVNRHPKYKTDLCRTYHSVGFCPYGPRCHFIHALDELRSAPVSPQEKKSPGTVKQLPMYGGPNTSNNTWTFPPNKNNNNNNNTLQADMKVAAAQLGNFFNLNNQLRPATHPANSVDSSRSGSLCSELDNLSMNSGSPPPDSSCTSPLDVSRNLRLPIFNRLA